MKFPLSHTVFAKKTIAVHHYALKGHANVTVRFNPLTKSSIFMEQQLVSINNMKLTCDFFYVKEVNIE